jgi:hypothetical protein
MMCNMLEKVIRIILLMDGARADVIGNECDWK